MKLIKSAITNLLGPVYSNCFREWFLSKKNRHLNAKRTALFRLFLKPGDTYFDVGANMGNRILPALDCGAKVVAVEPQPLCQAVLRRRYGSKINLVPKALGENDAVLKMYISDVHTLSSLAPVWIEKVSSSGRFNHIKWIRQIDVPVTTLDSLAGLYGVPSFVKIDVEGYELEVLKGLSTKVKVVSVEYTVPEQIDKLLSCIERMHKLSADYKYNYSVGETAKLALEQWVDFSAIIPLVQSEGFKETNFGDLYARLP